MDLETVCKRILKNRNQESGTNKRLADKSQVSQAYVNMLLNGKRPIMGLSLRKFLQIFPEAKTILERELGGQGAHQTASANGDGAAASVGGIAIAGGVIPDYQQSIMDAIINDDSMCDKCRTIALRHICSVANNKE